MTLIAITASLVGFYFLYNTSARADVRKDKVSQWFQRQTLFSKVTGLCLLVVSFIAFVIAHGLGAGVLFSSVTLMTSGSLIVLLSPLIKTN